jgi:hypothetical protein
MGTNHHRSGARLVGNHANLADRVSRPQGYPLTGSHLNRHFSGEDKGQMVADAALLVSPSSSSLDTVDESANWSCRKGEVASPGRGP